MAVAHAVEYVAQAPGSEREGDGGKGEEDGGVQRMGARVTMVPAGGMVCSPQRRVRQGQGVGQLQVYICGR